MYLMEDFRNLCVFKLPPTSRLVRGGSFAVVVAHSQYVTLILCCFVLGGSFKSVDELNRKNRSSRENSNSSPDFQMNFQHDMLFPTIETAKNEKRKKT